MAEPLIPTIVAAPRAGQTKRRWRHSSVWWLIWFAAAMLVMPGCGGCSHDTTEDPEAIAKAAKEELKKKDKPKPDFDPVKLRILPQKTDEKDVALRYVKPGHWTAAVEELKANNFDFQGQLYAEARADAAGQPVELEHTANRVAITRPAPLAKGQQKFLELLFFVPRDRAKQTWLSTELRSRGGGVAATPGAEPLSMMKAHQYHMVVLANTPDRYKRLETLDSVKAPHTSGNLDLESNLRYYSVVTPPLTKPLPLPTNVLAWSSIAYLVWDDVDPALLSPEQQQALIDWLHFGGQLIMSGPKSLDLLRGKAFLGPYLPALPGEPLAITAKELDPLSQFWSKKLKTGEETRPLVPVTPWSGITLEPTEGSEFLPNTNDLVVERRVGRGRIVATAFSLTQRDLWNWPSLDGFFNACLLRREPRYFSGGQGSVNVDWANDPQAARDPLRVTQLRFMSRDWLGDSGFATVASRKVQPTVDPRYQQYGNAFNPAAQPLDEDESPAVGPGVAAWNDFSPLADAARDSLREAAGIEIPKARFVVWVLILYLIVLVPVNWGVFAAIGRVEWAWIAAPIIAVGGMAAVVKLAQLDIGFARSQSEIAILELHNGYPRGHLTRFTALYTSLSTTYDVNPDERTTLILPFCADPNFTPRLGQSIDTVTYHCEPTVQLTDFGVSSNSTSFLHSEEMFDLGGSIDYVAKADSAEVSNRSKQHLQRAVVLRRNDRDQREIAAVGDLPSGHSAALNFVPFDGESADDAALLPSFNLTSPTEEGTAKFSLDRLAKLVRSSKSLQPGEVRLVALIDGVLPGLHVDPAASQSGKGATLVVEDLRPPKLDPPRPDANAHRDISDPREERERVEDPGADDSAETG